MNEVFDTEEKEVKVKEENVEKSDKGTEIIKEELNSLEINPSELTEVALTVPDDENVVSLKNPQEVYLEIYKKALDKANEAKHIALQKILEAKNIKNAYMIDEFDDAEYLKSFEELTGTE